MFEKNTVWWKFSDAVDLALFRRVTVEGFRKALEEDDLRANDVVLPWTMSPSSDPFGAMGDKKVLWQWHLFGADLSTPGDVMNAGGWIVLGLAKFTKSLQPGLSWALARREMLADAGKGEVLDNAIHQERKNIIGQELLSRAAPFCEVFPIAIHLDGGEVLTAATGKAVGDIWQRLNPLLLRAVGAKKWEVSPRKWSMSEAAPGLINPMTVLQGVTSGEPKALVLTHPHTKVEWFAAHVQRTSKIGFQVAGGEFAIKGDAIDRTVGREQQIATLFDSVPQAIAMSVFLADVVRNWSLTLNFTDAGETLVAKVSGDVEMEPTEGLEKFELVRGAFILAIDKALWCRRVVEGFWRALERECVSLTPFVHRMEDTSVGIATFERLSSFLLRRELAGQLDLFPGPDGQEQPKDVGSGIERVASGPLPEDEELGPDDVFDAPAPSDKSWLPSEAEIAEAEPPPPVEKLRRATKPPALVSKDQEVDILKQRLKSMRPGALVPMDLHQRLRALTYDLEGADGVARYHAWLGLLGLKIADPSDEEAYDAPRPAPDPLPAPKRAGRGTSKAKSRKG